MGLAPANSLPGHAHRSVAESTFGEKLNTFEP